MMSIQKIREAFPQRGKVKWIGLRPDRGEPVVAVESVVATIENGLVGDRYVGPPSAERQVSLIQLEHLAVMGELLGKEKAIPSELTRRNIVVSKINLTALKGAEFSIGDVVLRGNGGCAPCSKMEDFLGEGGYNAMRGHGGIVASVIQPGTIRIGDELEFQRLVR